MMRSSRSSFELGSRRLFWTSVLAVMLVLGALGSPLPALRIVLPADRFPGKGGTPAELAPAAAAPVGPPLTARVGARGRQARIYFPDAQLAGGPEERARQLLALESNRLGIRVASTDLGPADVPIWGAEAVVSFDAVFAPTVVASDLEDVQAADLVPPVLDREQALSRALAEIAPQGPLYAPAETKLWLRRRGEQWAYEHRVGFACATPSGDWEVWIDSATGDVREVRDRTVFGPPVQGQARIFRIDPCLATGDPSLQDQDDADAAVPASAYEDVLLPNLDPPSGGWYRLQGRWARLIDW
jgi:hypothetical protein